MNTMKKTVLLICLLLASICINAAPVKIGDLFYTLYSSDLTAIVDCAPSGESYAELTTLTLPATVTYNGKVYSVLSVAEDAFGKCPNLETVYWNIVNCGRIYYSDAHPFYASSRTTQFKHIIFGEGVKTIPMYVCYKQYELEDVVIPSGVTSILRNAFAECSKLQTVTLPEGLTTLGISAFLNCSKLTSINIPASLKVINDYAFKGCSQLASVDLHEGVTEIDQEAFAQCAFTEVTIPSTATYVGEKAFKSIASLKTVNWNPTTCNNYGGYDVCPFYNSTGITTFVIGNNVTMIPKYLCYNLSDITEITIPSSVQSIGLGAFYQCSGLKEVVLPEGLTSTGGSVFKSCSNLQSVTIPNSLNKINDYMFQYCSKLASINLREGITYIGDAAFEQCAFTEVTVPSTATYVGEKAFKSIASLKTVNWNPTTCNNYGGYDVCPFYNSTGITTFVIGSNVTMIPAYLCYNLSGITEITIPSSVQSIGLGAFYQCSGLTKVVLNEGLTSTGGSVFKSCSNLKSINIPKSLKTINNYTFQYCSKLTSVNLHDDITRIGTEAFRETGLTTVTVPRSVTSLGEAPFRRCANLTKVYWKATNTTCSGYSDTHPFYQCTGIKTVVFSGNVEKIPNVAFYNASSLSLIINFSILPQTINANVFYNVNKETCELWVPEVSKDLYLAADVWKDFAKQANAPAVESEFEDTACDSYTWNKKTFMESGDYKDTLQTELGQDSIITLHLTINHSTFGEETQEAEGSYEWHNEIYTQSGDYEFVTTNTAGCDSTVTLHLTITEPEIPTALPSAKDEQMAAEKIIRDGQLCIRRKENTYTATGLKVE